jgi:hypothetical protein
VQVGQDQVFERNHHQPQRRRNRGGEQKLPAAQLGRSADPHPQIVSSTIATASPTLAAASAEAPASRASASNGVKDALTIGQVAASAPGCMPGLAGDRLPPARPEAGRTPRRASTPAT